MIGRLPKVAGFDWDAGNTSKCRSHGMETEEVEAVFLNSPAVFPDPSHSWGETRLRAIGPATDGRMAFVVFTLREGAGRLLIRPISARWMHKREIESYERQTQAAPRPSD